MIKRIQAHATELILIVTTTMQYFVLLFWSLPVTGSISGLRIFSMTAMYITGVVLLVSSMNPVDITNNYQASRRGKMLMLNTIVFLISTLAFVLTMVLRWIGM